MGPDQLLVLEYHYGDTYATTESELKVKEYKVQGFPSMFFDGGNNQMGGDDRSYDRYLPVVNKELAGPSIITISGNMTVIDSAYFLTASVTNVGSTKITNAKLMAVVYQDIGTDAHRYVARDILPANAVDVLSPGVPQLFVFNSQFPVDASTMKAVIFLNSSSGEVLQATLCLPQ
jgi:hypothetical protein